MEITIEKAKVLFKAGALKSPTATEAPMSGEKYMLLFEVKQELGWHSAYLVSKRKKIREFSKLEAAKATVISIGFKASKIIFG